MSRTEIITLHHLLDEQGTAQPRKRREPPLPPERFRSRATSSPKGNMVACGKDKRGRKRGLPVSLQIDMRFLDRERLGEVAGAASDPVQPRLNSGSVLGADAPARSGSGCGNGNRSADPTGDGGSPARMMRLRVFWISGSGTGTADSSDCVYGMVRLAIERLPVRNLDHLTQST